MGDNSDLDIGPVTARSLQYLICRGLCFALAFAIIGYLIPFVVLGIRDFTYSYPIKDLVAEFVDFHRNFDPGELIDIAAAPGLALVFGLSAFVTFSSPARQDLVRNLLLIAVSAIAGAYMTGFAFDLLGLRVIPNSSNPDAWLALWVMALFPTGVAVLICLRNWKAR